MGYCLSGSSEKYYLFETKIKDINISEYSIHWGHFHPFGWNNIDKILTKISDYKKERNLKEIRQIKEKWGCVVVYSNFQKNTKELSDWKDFCYQLLKENKGLENYFSIFDYDEKLIKEFNNYSEYKSYERERELNEYLKSIFQKKEKYIKLKINDFNLRKIKLSKLNKLKNFIKKFKIIDNVLINNENDDKNTIDYICIIDGDLRKIKESIKQMSKIEIKNIENIEINKNNIKIKNDIKKYNLTFDKVEFYTNYTNNFVFNVLLLYKNNKVIKSIYFNTTVITY